MTGFMSSARFNGGDASQDGDGLCYCFFEPLSDGEA